jgi:hypothetical protein
MADKRLLLILEEELKKPGNLTCVDCGAKGLNFTFSFFIIINIHNNVSTEYLYYYKFYFDKLNYTFNVINHPSVHIC